MSSYLAGERDINPAGVEQEGQGLLLAADVFDEGICLIEVLVDVLHIGRALVMSTGICSSQRHRAKTPQKSAFQLLGRSRSYFGLPLCT